jgi:hypothetical protein
MWWLSRLGWLYRSIIESSREADGAALALGPVFDWLECRHSISPIEWRKSAGAAATACRRQGWTLTAGKEIWL